MKRLLVFLVLALGMAMLAPGESNAQAVPNPGTQTCFPGTATQWSAIYSGSLYAYPLCPLGVIQVASAAVTGGGFTQYPATSVTTAGPTQIGSGALTLASLTASWSVPSTASTCWLTLYDSATTPTDGTGFIWISPLTTSSAGTLSLGIAPTVGMKIVNGLWYAVTTTPTGSTACNTTANELWIMGLYK